MRLKCETVLRGFCTLDTHWPSSGYTVPSCTWTENRGVFEEEEERGSNNVLGVTVILQVVLILVGTRGSARYTVTDELTLKKPGNTIVCFTSLPIIRRGGPIHLHDSAQNEWNIISKSRSCRDLCGTRSARRNPVSVYSLHRHLTTVWNSATVFGLYADTLKLFDFQSTFRPMICAQTRMCCFTSRVQSNTWSGGIYFCHQGFEASFIIEGPVVQRSGMFLLLVYCHHRWSSSSFIRLKHIVICRCRLP
jgi:hypothetical protein